MQLSERMWLLLVLVALVSPPISGPLLAGRSASRPGEDAGCLALSSEEPQEARKPKSSESMFTRG